LSFGPVAGVSLLSGVSAWPPPDGVGWGAGGPIYQRAVVAFAAPLGGLRPRLIHRPGDGTSLRRLVSMPP